MYLTQTLTPIDPKYKPQPQPKPQALEMRDVNGMTPLSIALSLCAPYWVLSGLVKMCPKAIDVPDNGGWYPIHFATRQNPGDVLELLLRACPGAALKTAITRGEAENVSAAGFPATRPRSRQCLPCPLRNRDIWNIVHPAPHPLHVDLPRQNL